MARRPRPSSCRVVAVVRSPARGRASPPRSPPPPRRRPPPVATAPPAATSPPVAGAVIVDHFRPPATPYAAGNRGLDDGHRAGRAGRGRRPPARSSSPVRSPAPCTSRIRHADGLRTSYSFLAAVVVRVGRRRCEQGAADRRGRGRLPLRRARPRRHLPRPRGAVRPAGPAPTSCPGPTRARRRSPSRRRRSRRWSSVERSAGGRRGGRPGAGRGRLGAALRHEARPVVDPTSLAAPDRRGRSAGATSAATAPRPSRRCRRPTGRRIAVLVGGLGSTQRAAGRRPGRRRPTLGYAPGRRRPLLLPGRPGPGPGRAAAAPLAAVADARPTTAGRHRGRPRTSSADRLRRRSSTTVGPRPQPGVPIDVIAHSQGGVVARLAAGEPGARPASAARRLEHRRHPRHPAPGRRPGHRGGRGRPRSAAGRALGRPAGRSGLDLDLDAEPAIDQLGRDLGRSSPSWPDRRCPTGVRLRVDRRQRRPHRARRAHRR